MTELGGDLARAQSLIPELLEKFDALIGPGHPDPLALLQTFGPNPSLVAIREGTRRCRPPSVGPVSVAPDVVFD
jgi:hypothetical protein